MRPELRQLIIRSKWHQSALEAVAALLPADDLELDTLIADAVRGNDQAGFLFVTVAAGEPAAFVGVVRLKACHGIFRQRIGSDFRLLFRLHPDRVQVIDLIPRQDLLRRIKTLV